VKSNLVAPLTSFGDEASVKFGKRLFKGIVKAFGNIEEVRRAEEAFVKAQEHKENALQDITNSQTKRKGNLPSENQQRREE
jgi:hypothetical protein